MFSVGWGVRKAFLVPRALTRLHVLHLGDHQVGLRVRDF